MNYTPMPSLKRVFNNRHTLTAVTTKTAHRSSWTRQRKRDAVKAWLLRFLSQASCGDSNRFFRVTPPSQSHAFRKQPGKFPYHIWQHVTSFLRNRISSEYEDRDADWSKSSVT